MISSIITAFFMVIILFKIWSDLSCTNLNWKSIRTWLFVIITTILTLLNYFNINFIMKFITLTLIFIFINKFLFKLSFRQSIASPILTQTMYLIAESIFVCIMLFFLKNDTEKFMNNYFGAIVTNMGESIIVIILHKTRLFNKIYNILNNKLSKLDEITFLFFSIFAIGLYSIFSFNIYYHVNQGISFLISAGITVLSFILIGVFLKVKADYYKINEKYNNSLNSLKELENALMNHRIDNHENKNQLMTIRNMTTNKKVVKFIDSILDNKLKDNNNILHETSVIPSGGLRGLIYSKLLVMSNKNIEYELDISNTVRVVDILDYGDETMLDVCKIVGIFLDNAIEEVEAIDDKYIAIEMYKDEEIFTISIMNTYNSSIDKTNIYKAGVSTKGGNHGYGLSLVKKLVNNNCKLKTKTEITDDEFTQILYVHK